MSDTLVRLETDGHLGIVTLYRPEKFNALDIPTLEALARRLDEIEAAEKVRVVLICGKGKGFCAGGDVDAWSALSAADFQTKWIRLGNRVFDRLARLRQPTIAVLSGHALGGGLELAAAADFRVAEKHAKIGFPETGIGVVPGWSGTQRAVRRFGAQAVRRMAIGGEVLTAEAAFALGIVDRLAETGQGLEEARAWAAVIAARGPLATETTKAMIAIAEGDDDAAADVLASGFVAMTGDLRAGVAAFRDKRTPAFGRK
ncbi:enoyl-CoA hydratase/isomerase family protein [Chelativorans alearense]|uniref:enoyl-CoA hydratase/isomerase family protein n=1 Tax=Chelativorans alearense TaxID=2681495 RepID=UPI0013D19B4B|nr:enoyl-CoA hydratase/isomerase family protein [Chelativorans alearense]